MSDSLSVLWSARSLAVIGASERPGALGRLPIQFLHRYGYPGSIYPIRPDAMPVLGLPSYRRVADCPVPIDLAMILLGADRVPAAVDDCVSAGVPAAIICSSGFAETGPTGALLQDEIVAKACAGGLRLLGPNCIGTVGVATGQVTSFSPLFAGAGTQLIDGCLGFVSQSGALGYGAVSLAFERGLGLGWVVNTGNEADITAFEVMAALAREPGCCGLLGYVESLPELAPMRRVAASGVPVAVLKGGRSDAGQRAAASHTAALASADRVVDAAFRQLGIVAVDDVDELLDVGDAFASPRRPAGPRVAVLTTSGGSGILAADALERHGLQLAELSQPTRAVLDDIVPAFGATANPVDVTATVMSKPDLFERALDALIEDDGVDTVIACFCVLTGDDVTAVLSSLDRVAQRSGKPVLVARTGADQLAPGAAAAMRAAGVPSYPTPSRAVRAAAALVQVSRPRSAAPAAPRAVGCAAPPRGSTEAELKQLLAEAGLPVPAGRVALSRHDAVAAVAELGGRAVLKALAPGLAHKSEVGGVVVGVGVDDAAATYDRLTALAETVLVEELVPGGVEVLVGVTTSPLGLVLTLGPGGVLTELLDDVALRLLPVGRTEIEQMIDETRLATLLTGVRGAQAADRAALVDMVLALTAVVAGWPPGGDLELNPVTVLAVGHGVRVLDAAYVAPGVD